MIIQRPNTIKESDLPKLSTGEIELAPCPFCGYPAALMQEVRDTGVRQMYAKCTRCGAEGPKIACSNLRSLNLWQKVVPVAFLRGGK